MPVSDSAPPLCGVFVGGMSRRMGGHPKGLLPHPSGQGTLVEHIVRVARHVGAEPVLIGAHPAYVHLGLRLLSDAREDAGPMAGLESLLRDAGPRNAFAIACDLPHVPPALLLMLRDAMGPDVDAVLPRREGGLEPLCALYRASRVLPLARQALHEGRLGLQQLARRLRMVELRLEGEQARWLDDWDEPRDMVGF